MVVRLMLLLAVLLSGCGYRVGTKPTLIPDTVKTIAVPAFENATTRYKLSDAMAIAVTRELIARTRYDVVRDASQADAVLSGTVLNVMTFPTIFDPGTGRASGVQVSVFLQVTLRDRAGKILFSRPNLAFNQRYEISVDPNAYFEESNSAMERLSRDTARSVVSAILEAF